MMLIDDIWRSLEVARELGGARRVSENDPNDFYCCLDTTGRRGLLLVCDTKPPTTSSFDKVDLVAALRADQRYALWIWLKDASLNGVFSRLCQDLVDASRSIDSSNLPRFVVARLARWQELLESSDSDGLVEAGVRGLVGELIILKQHVPVLGCGIAVGGWVGPLGAPQDFIFPSFSLEVKTIAPSSTTITISSLEQLFVGPGATLKLAILVLAPAPLDSSSSISVEQLVDDIRSQLTDDAQTSGDFERRFAATGYTTGSIERRRFYLLQQTCYDVTDDFPKLTRNSVPPGIVDAKYAIEITACASFEQEGGSIP